VACICTKQTNVAIRLGILDDSLQRQFEQAIRSAEQIDINRHRNAAKQERRRSAYFSPARTPLCLRHAAEMDCHHVSLSEYAHAAPRVHITSCYQVQYAAASVNMANTSQSLLFVAKVEQMDESFAPIPPVIPVRDY